MGWGICNILLLLCQTSYFSFAGVNECGLCHLSQSELLDFLPISTRKVTFFQIHLSLYGSLERLGHLSVFINCLSGVTVTFVCSCHSPVRPVSSPRTAVNILSLVFCCLKSVAAWILHSAALRSYHLWFVSWINHFPLHIMYCNWSKSWIAPSLFFSRFFGWGKQMGIKHKECSTATFSPYLAAIDAADSRWLLKQTWRGDRLREQLLEGQQPDSSPSQGAGSTPILTRIKRI